MNHVAVSAAMGFTQDASPEDNLEGLRRALGDAPADVAHRRRALAAIATQSMEFREHLVEYGQPYDSAAIADDGSAASPLLEDVRLYVRAVRIGHLDGDYRDPRCAWLARREIGPRGAVLVRPDRYVAWRSLDAAADPAGTLRAVFRRILCRSA